MDIQRAEQDGDQQHCDPPRINAENEGDAADELREEHGPGEGGGEPDLREEACEAGTVVEQDGVPRRMGAGEFEGDPVERGVAEKLMRGSLAMHVCPDNPHGCLKVIGTMACGTEADCIREAVIERGAESKRALLARFERAKEEGDLPSDTDVEGLTAILVAMNQGMAVQASAGATPAELERLVEAALKLWPSR